MGRSYHSGPDAAPSDPSKGEMKQKQKTKSVEDSVKDLQRNPTHHAPGKGTDVWTEGVKKIKKAFGID